MKTVRLTVLCAVVPMLAALLAAAGGCAAPAAEGEEDPDSFQAVKDIHGGPHTDMMLVYLVTGPGSAGHSKERKAELFAGHMANMKRLSEARQLLVAGPFAKPRDAAWRGIFIIDTPSITLARQLVATDPAVAAGEFEARFVPVKAHISLRLALEREAALAARTAPSAVPSTSSPPAPAAPSAPPPNIRAYTMLTATTTAAAADAAAHLRASGLESRVIFALRATGGPGGDSPLPAKGGAVFVLDATAPAEIAAALATGTFGSNSQAGAGAVGAFGLDGWWSTAALTDIDPAARTLPRALR